MWPAALALAAFSQQLEVVRQDPKPVLTNRHPAAAKVRYGFEGGRVVKVGSVYHLFTSEMADAPIWAKMRLAHWRSRDGNDWTRVSTLYESSGDAKICNLICRFRHQFVLILPLSR